MALPIERRSPTWTTVCVLLAAVTPSLASCTVDAGPSPTACDATGSCRAGYVCNAATQTCVPGTHRVSVALAGTGAGAVRSMPAGIDCGATCSVQLDYGAMLALEATADAMSTFEGWSGDCAGTGACMVTADHDVAVTATFVRRTFELTVTPAGSGRGAVRSMPAGIDCGATCAARFDIGTRVTLTATPEPGSTFEGWSGDCTGRTTCEVTMDAAHAVGASFSPGGVVWARRFGGTAYDAGSVLAADGAGDALVGGYFQGDADLGGGMLRSAGAEEIFVAKYAGADGAHVWSRALGGIDSDRAQALGVDAAGDVFVSGFYSETVDFGSGARTSAGSFDLFVAKLSGVDGSVLWSRVAGGTGTDGAFGLAVDPSGDVVVVGNFQRTVDFGSGTPFTATGLFDAFVAKYRGADGSVVWSRAIGGAGTDFADRVTTDRSGNVFVAGTFDAEVSLGTAMLLPAGNTDVYLAQLSGADGTPVRAAAYGGTGFDYSNAIAFDRTDDTVVFAAAFDGTATFGGAALVSTGFLDIAVVKLTPGGTTLWSRAIGGVGREYPYGLAPTAGGIALVGAFAASIDVGRTLTSAGDDDGLVASLGTDGAPVWARAIGGMATDSAQSVAAAPDDTLFVTGGFEGVLDLDGTVLTSAGMGDVFLAKLGD